MKSFLKAKVVSILSFLSRKTLASHNPIIIAITGNIGKTTTKDYIYNFLSYKFGNDEYEEVRASAKSENSEFGVNLTVLGESNAWSNGLAWAVIIIRNFLRLFVGLFIERSYPRILVVEVGADKPGDIRYITSIIKPDVVVLTAFQSSPTHGEFFLNIDQHINEKKVLVDSLKKDGVIIYNSDDAVMTAMAKEKMAKTPGVKIFSFGSAEGSNICIIENANMYSDDSEILGVKVRLGIKFGELNDEVEFKLLGVVGNAQAYSLAAALCVAVLNGFNKQDAMEISNTTLDFSKSRMRILSGINSSKIIDDSYNSSPKAAENAIETVSKILNKGKKIAILGHMAELGKKTRDEHFNIGLLASKYFDSIILSGKYNDFFLEGIREGKFELSRVFLADNPEAVLQIIRDQGLINEQDLVLVKGSQSARLEKVVAGLLINPRDRQFVCRQDKEWKDR